MPGTSESLKIPVSTVPKFKSSHTICGRVGPHLDIIPLLETKRMNKATTAVDSKDGHSPSPVGAQALAKQHVSRELIFGIVGHVGSGTSTVAQTLETVLGGAQPGFDTYECAIIRAREVISEWATINGKSVPSDGDPSIVDVRQYQNLGDDMRESIDHAAVAVGAIKENSPGAGQNAGGDDRQR